MMRHVLREIAYWGAIIGGPLGITLLIFCAMTLVDELAGHEREILSIAKPIKQLKQRKTKLPKATARTRKGD